MGRTFRSIILVVILQAAAIGNAPAAPGRDTVLIGYEPGTIVVKTSERRLYYVLEKGQTVSYPVAVGKAGKTWTGVAHIQGKFLKPACRLPRTFAGTSQTCRMLFRVEHRRIQWGSRP